MSYNAIPIMTQERALACCEGNDLIARVEYFADGDEGTGDPIVAGWVVLSDCADDEETAFHAADCMAVNVSEELGRHCVVIIPRN